jgi:branched-chain amino acid transport system permease protein
MYFLIHFVALVCILLPTIVGYNLVFGRGKVFHFGQIGLQLLAAYPMWILIARFDAHPILGFLSGIIGAFLAALFLAWLSFRLEPDGLGVMSIAVHLAVLNVVLNWQSVTRGALGIPMIPRLFFTYSNEVFTLVALAIALSWTVFVWWLDRSSFGRALSALAEHNWHAESLGVERKRIHTIAFMVASGGALLTSLMLPSYLYLLSPSDFMFPSMIFIVMCIVAGGPGNVWGGVLATFTLIALREGLRLLPMAPAVLGPVRLLLFGLILFGAVWWRRDVLFPKQRKI